MPRNEDSCPFEPRARASQCESCATKSGLPPCVAAYVRGSESMAVSNVVPLYRVVALNARKAA